MFRLFPQHLIAATAASAVDDISLDDLSTDDDLSIDYLDDL